MYSPMHGSVGLLLGALLSRVVSSFPLLYALGALLAFISHFICDLYPDYYPIGGWNKKNVLRHWFLWLIIGAIIAFQIYMVVDLRLYLFLLLCYVFANLVDISEAIYRIFRKPSLWVCHPNGWFPWRAKRWQLGRMELTEAIVIEIFINLIIVIFVYWLLK